MLPNFHTKYWVGVLRPVIEFWGVCQDGELHLWLPEKVRNWKASAQILSNGWNYEKLKEFSADVNTDKEKLDF